MFLPFDNFIFSFRIFVSHNRECVMLLYPKCDIVGQEQIMIDSSSNVDVYLIDLLN